LQLVVAVAPGVTSVSNTASVATTGDSNSGNNSAATGGIPTTPAPDLSLQKAATGSFSVGQPASYTLTVTNTGAGPTIGVITVTDTFRPSRFVSAAGPGWSFRGRAAGHAPTRPVGAGGHQHDHADRASDSGGGAIGDQHGDGHDPG
jgi:uncharacterized repeat protein (TIGR01451 family)